MRYFVSRGFELFCAQSFSKIFGLYGERVGSLSVVHKEPSTMASVMEHLTSIAYDMYLSPPKHGALIVETILNDNDLYEEWQQNLQVMPNRIKTIRQTLYNELIRLKTPGTWNHIIDQIGMFSYTGLSGTYFFGLFNSFQLKYKLKFGISEKQVQFINEIYHIYLRKTGRISMSGLNQRNVTYVAEAIHAAVTAIPN